MTLSQSDKDSRYETELGTVLKHVPNWTQIRTLGSSKLVKSSYVWIFAAPLLAKSLKSIESPINIAVLGDSYPIHLELPFSWKMFFIAACFFSLASLIYAWKCPKNIKEYAHYRDFYNKSRSYLEMYAEVLADEPKNCEVSPYLLLGYAIGTDQYEHYERNLTRNIPDTPDIITKLKSSPPDETDLPDVFWFIQSGTAKRHAKIRLFCSVLYAIGSSLFLWIMIQNILYVICTGY